jgi:hypothetical protein
MQTLNKNWTMGDSWMHLFSTDGPMKGLQSSTCINRSISIIQNNWLHVYAIYHIYIYIYIYICFLVFPHLPKTKNMNICIVNKLTIIIKCMRLNDIRIACGFGMDGLSLETTFF